MNEVEKLTKETIRNGGVLAMLYFDIHTRSKEKAQELGAAFVQQLIHEKDVAYAVGEIDEPIVNGEQHSTTVQVRILTKSFVSLATICAVHSPFSLEIIQPDEVKLSIAEAHELLTTIGLVTADYKKIIIEKVSTPEERRRFQDIMEAKAQLGKRILNRKDSESKGVEKK